ncbi:MAG: DUF559 domain-containing protein [Nostoc sp.]
MVQAPPRTSFNPKGTVHSHSDNSIVSVAPQLPFYVEVRTDSLITYLSEVYKFTDRVLIQKWLDARHQTGFYFEITEHLHLAFADQRDGRGTQYWWCLYYDNIEKKKIFGIVKIQEHLVRTKVENEIKKEKFLWNGLTFRSETEIRIAKALSSLNLMFFANIDGFMGLNGLPISNQDNKSREKAEVDFLVFHNQKCMILEVDGQHHNNTFNRQWDYKRDRVFLRQGIFTVRFSAEQCYENATAVVKEFLELFN